jgi:hypothetical protein
VVRLPVDELRARVQLGRERAEVIERFCTA